MDYDPTKSSTATADPADPAAQKRAIAKAFLDQFIGPLRYRGECRKAFCFACGAPYGDCDCGAHHYGMND